MDSSVKTLTPSEIPKRKNPWGLPPAAQAGHTPCSLAAVMDEELAKKLQTEEEEAFSQELSGPPHLSSALTVSESDTRDDHLLAQMLQLEFDRENDRLLRAEEKQYNRESKVRVSLERYRSLPASYLEDDDEDQLGEEEEEAEGGERVEPTPSVSRGRRRSKGVPVGMATKHDPVVCGRRNARNVEKFPIDFPCGDMGDETKDFRLPNSVYNTLREHSYREERHAQRLHEKKEHSTHEHVFDPKTRLMIFKMVDNGVLTEVNGCISTGKEASVYHAGGGTKEDVPLPAECAIKVFKTTLNEFKNRDRYIKDDYRFKDRFSKQNPRKVVRLWAEKEMHNLKRLNEGGISCPEVVFLRKHILIMSFIGHDQKPAPTLKEIRLPSELMRSAYEQCIHGMRKMFTECRLIHADLSEYNMLWHDGKVVFIDVSQSVEPSHPQGLEFLLRDCTNVSNFFTRVGVRDVMTAHRLFNYVSGMEIKADTNEEFLVQIRNHRQREQLLQLIHSREQPYPFDYFFDQSARGRGEGTPRAQDDEHSSSSEDEGATA